MSFLSFFQLFQANAWQAEKISNAGIGLAIVCLSLIIYFQYKQVNETQNTLKFSKGFCFGQLFSYAFLIVASAFRIANSSNSPADNVHVNIALIFTISFLFLVNLYTLRVKFANIASAKKSGMTEVEHYEQVIAPSLRTRVNF